AASPFGPYCWSTQCKTDAECCPGMTCSGTYTADDQTYQYCEGRNGSEAAHNFADVDGDGIADMVYLNKVNPAGGWSPYGPTPYLGMAVLPGRGDGRFGAPTNQPSGACYDSFSNYVIPGGTSSTDTPLQSPSPTLSTDPLQKSLVRFGDLN